MQRDFKMHMNFNTIKSTHNFTTSNNQQFLLISTRATTVNGNNYTVNITVNALNNQVIKMKSNSCYNDAVEKNIAQVRSCLRQINFVRN